MARGESGVGVGRADYEHLPILFSSVILMTTRAVDSCLFRIVFKSFQVICALLR